MASQTPSNPDAAKPKRGFLTYLLVMIVLLGLAGGGWFGYQQFAKKSSGEGDQAESEGGKGGGHGASAKAQTAPPKMAVPLVPDKVVFVPKLHGKELTSDMIVSTNSKAPKKIIVQLADTKQTRYAMAQIFLASNNTDELIDRVNANQPALYEKISKRISDKTVKEIHTPGFRNRIRAELFYECNRMLGSNVVQEIIISELVTQ